MSYTAKSYEHLLGTPGFSDTLLTNHFTLYQGYVKNVNTITENLAQLREEEKTTTPAYAEQKRRLGWEYNGMRLHEYYFENMLNGGAKLDKGSLWDQMDKDFGATEKSWHKDFLATGSMRGIGWVVLCYDPEAKRLFNVWINEHDVGYLAGSIPLLVMDVFEHAFMIDYGIKRADYLEAFMKAVDWTVVCHRFEKALHS